MSFARRQIAAVIFLVAWSAPIAARGEGRLTLQDAIVGPDGKTRLVAYLYREAMFGIPKDIEYTSVTFFVGTKEIGKADTGDSGIARLDCTFPDEKADEFSARATYSGEELQGSAGVFRWNPKKIIVCVDIDGTISRTDLDDVVFDEIDEDSKPLNHAPETLKDLAKEYEILYLTARPSLLLDKTRYWLADRGFPLGPVVVSHRKRDLLQQAEYKERMLRDLQKSWPNILIGIGDTLTDAEAYGERGMLTIIVRGKRLDKIGRHALLMPDWKSIHGFFKNNRDQLQNAKACRSAIAGEQPLLQTLNAYREGE